MVKRETEDGKTEILEAQPFLICQPMDDTMTSQPKRKSSQLNLPSLLNKLRRPSKSSSVFSGESSHDPESPTKDELLLAAAAPDKRTRASICFVPMGHSFADPDKPHTDWTPLHGFVYSSFVMSRRPSYKQACTSPEQGCTVTVTPPAERCNSDETIMVVPSRASFVRSLSQPATETSTVQNDDDVNDVVLNGRTRRKASKVSFQLQDPNDDASA